MAGIIRKSTERGLNYGVTFTEASKRAVVFVDFHHSAACENNPVYRDAILALRAFKDDDPFWITRFGDAMAKAALADFRGRPTSIVPVLGSRELEADQTSRVVQVAGMISRALGVRLRTDLFRQTATRQRLHEQRRLPYAARNQQVLDVLTCAPAAGERIVLVDDVLTTSATQEAYIQRIQEQGGSVFGIVVMMRHENLENLMNPGLYDRDVHDDNDEILG